MTYSVPLRKERLMDDCDCGCSDPVGEYEVIKDEIRACLIRLQCPELPEQEAKALYERIDALAELAQDVA